MLQLPRALRTLLACVVFLLAANAAVVVTHLADDLADAAPPAASGSIETPAVDATVVREIAVITTADGRQIVVDPSTPEGLAAIAEAIARGDTVDTRRVAVRSSDRRGNRAGDASGEALSQAELDAVLKGGDAEALLRAVTTLPVAGASPAAPTTLLPAVGDAVDRVLDEVNGVVEDVNGVVEQTRRTVNDVVEDVTDAVNDLPDGTTVSVPGVPVTVTTPPVTTPPVSVVVTTPPVTVSVPVATTVVTLPPVTVTVTVPPVTVTVPPVTLPPVTVPPVTTATTAPCLVLC
jgi:hypothetical protein